MTVGVKVTTWSFGVSLGISYFVVNFLFLIEFFHGQVLHCNIERKYVRPVMTDKLELPVAGLPKARVVEFICGSSCTSWSRVESWCLTSSEVSEVSFCGVLPLLLLTARLSCHTSRLTAIRSSKQHQNKAWQSGDNDKMDIGKTCWTFRKKQRKRQ